MKIIMVDQDRVVCDENYQPTVDISELIRELNKTGQVIIAPNTDTPIERIKYNFRKMIGLDPAVIIAERGAIVEINGKKESVKNICGIKEFIAWVEKVFKLMGCCVEIGDSATWLRENRKFEPNRRLLIIDGLREQTISVFFKRTDASGFASTDPGFAQQGLEIINGLVPPAGLNKSDYNEKYGIAICNVAGVSKTDGYLLVKNQYPLADFYMIGDGDSDIILDKEVIHCAVANASPLLKKRASFVSKFSITEGLADCLKWICF